MGKVDQGVITLWVARHVFGCPLRYIGFGGQGKQVRDLLHVEDLFDLLVRQSAAPGTWDGRVYNVGGGPQVSASLRELTDVCRNVTGCQVPICPEPATSPVDIRVYLTDSRRVAQEYDWAPRKSVGTIVEDICSWVRTHEEQLRPLLT
jgi:CDP-paratose 2-epimerase